MLKSDGVNKEILHFAAIYKLVIYSFQISMNKFFLPLLLVIFFHCVSQTFAQNGWEVGYILDTQNDTIPGLIKYKNWFRNPDNIEFKKSGEDIVQELGISDITAFSVHGEKYFKAFVDIDISPDGMNDLPETSVPTIVADTVFLLVLVEGEKSLFQFKTDKDKIQLYIKNNSKFELLTNYRYKRYVNESPTVVVVDAFKQQLRYYLADCKQIENKLNLITYSDRSINKLFDSYYDNCSDTKQISRKERESKLTEFGAVAGVSLSNLKFYGRDTPVDLLTDFDKSTNITFGAFINFIIPRTRRRVSFCNDLLYTSYSAKSNIIFQSSENYHREKNVNIGYNYLKLSSLIRYQLPVKTVSIFFNAGVSNALAISKTNKITTHVLVTNLAPEVSVKEAISTPRNYEQGLVVGLGLKFKKYGFEFRREGSNGMATYLLMDSRVTRYYGLFSYQF